MSPFKARSFCAVQQSRDGHDLIRDRFLRRNDLRSIALFTVRALFAARALFAEQNITNKDYHKSTCTPTLGWTTRTPSCEREVLVKESIEDDESIPESTPDLHA